MLRDAIKSALLAVVGTGTFFFFLMMIMIPVLGVEARHGVVFTQSAVVDPDHILRIVGLPASALLFVVFFLLAMRHLRRDKLVTH
ncbi:MAG TPA: hypothetical protein VKW78_22085 [Terriglobales bacterium]|nr:hypothetical protein [Terriglobales bacterium]